MMHVKKHKKIQIKLVIQQNYEAMLGLYPAIFVGFNSNLNKQYLLSFIYNGKYVLFDK